MLLLELSGTDDNPLGTNLLSPILQVHGGQPVVETANYTFIRDYQEDDILSPWRRLFRKTALNLNL